MRAKDFRPPVLSRRFAHVWGRNFLVWRKLAIPSMLGNLADPMLYMLGLGYGLGAPVGHGAVVRAGAGWAASKSFLSGCAILIIIRALGLSPSPLTLWIVPLA